MVAYKALNDLSPLTNLTSLPVPLLFPHSVLATLVSLLLLSKCVAHPHLWAFELAIPSAVIDLRPRQSSKVTL